MEAINTERNPNDRPVPPPTREDFEAVSRALHAKDNAQEHILCAAIHGDDGRHYRQQPKNIESGMVICGHRHSHCIEVFVFAFRGATLTEATRSARRQGFLTSFNRFVEREEAARIAVAALQVSIDCERLYSEDLY
jgi:hypothetical protein